MLGAVIAWTMSPNLPIPSDLDFEDASDAALPIGVGVTSASLLYALAYWLRFERLLAICGLTARALTAVPGAPLIWLERHVLRVSTLHVE